MRSESKVGEESNGKLPQMPYAKNNRDPTPGSPMLGLSLKSLPQLVRKLFQRLIAAIPSQPTDMWKLFALLPCLLLVAEVKGNCSGLLACKKIFSFSEIRTIEALDQKCTTKLSSLTSCITDRLDTCDNSAVKKRVRISKGIREYMCSPEGRPVVIRIASLDCYKTTSMQGQIRELMKECRDNYRKDVNNAYAMESRDAKDYFRISCAFVDQLQTCWIQSVTNLCNADMGVFMANIGNIRLADRFAQYGCPQDIIQSRRFVKRTLPMLSKRLAAISKLKLKKVKQSAQDPITTT
ncbi:hypothetical protein PoB_000508400 [Plakobranchus ocellatus]|uniref:DUF19 domain-containing protein n=1 Tax=Plakobranchus ocellatus TaxID=259542 RepID=A0AAV3Y946_9GAST|nr:hypothetical protein PoB_000508400 [Plakobranchus ocellatus]